MFAAHEHPNPSKDAHSPHSLILRAFSRSVAHPGTENAVLAKGAALAAPPKTRRKFKKPQVSSPKKKGRKGFVPRKKKNAQVPWLCSSSGFQTLPPLEGSAAPQDARTGSGVGSGPCGTPGVLGSLGPDLGAGGPVIVWELYFVWELHFVWELQIFGTCISMGPAWGWEEGGPCTIWGRGWFSWIKTHQSKAPGTGRKDFALKGRATYRNKGIKGWGIPSGAKKKRTGDEDGTETP